MRKLSTAEWIGVGAALIIGGGLFVYFFGLFSSPFNFGTVPTDEAVQGVSTEEFLADYEDDVESGELRIDDIQTGSGAAITTGVVAVVHYVGLLSDGTVFDNSVGRGQPFIFEVGAGQVISGWEQGLMGMQEGGHRVIVVPPDLGYGEAGNGPIPPNATLIFEVQLLDVLSREEVEQLQLEAAGGTESGTEPDTAETEVVEE